MDQIALEVEKFHKKKDRLTQGFVAKMRSIINAKAQSVAQTGEVIQELEDKRKADQADMDRATRVLNEI